MERLRKLAAKVAAFWNEKKDSIKSIGIGHAIYDTTGWLFDNPLYISVIAVKGPIAGGLIMTSLSLVICFGTLIVYEKMRIEWTGTKAIDFIREKGIHYAKRMENGEGHRIFKSIIFFLPANFFIFVMKMIEKGGDVAAFFILSILEDPFYTTAYLRHGAFDGLKKKDYIVFFSSVLVSNGYWTLRNTGIVLAFRYIMQLFF
jgi:hypothetical protein